jgi:hypothetical protein
VTPRQRIVLLAIAAVILVGGIALAASGGDDESGSSGSTQAAPATTPAPAEEGTGTEADQPKPKPKPRVEEIEIRDGKPVGGEQRLEYERGDTIRLRFASDAPGEVHIHGFDKTVGVGPGGDKLVNFKATLEGIFEVEEHGSGEILAKLEIRPK